MEMNEYYNEDEILQYDDNYTDTYSLSDEDYGILLYLDRKRKDRKRNREFLLYVLLRRWWIICLCSLVAGIFVSMYNFYFAVPIFSSSTKIIITKSNYGENVSLVDLTASVKLVKDAAFIVKSDNVLKKAIDSLELTNTLTPDSLRKNLYITAITDTRILNITVENTSAEMSAKLANAIAVNFKAVFEDFLITNKYSYIQFCYTLEKANMNATPVKPNIPLNISLALIIGLLFGFIVIFVIELFDDRILAPEKVAFLSGLDTIAVIPVLDSEEDEKTN